MNNMKCPLPSFTIFVEYALVFIDMINRDPDKHADYNHIPLL